MELPIISIIVPVYNVEQYLSKCLDGLINQTMKEIEVICVNDGSIDQSFEILQKYSVKDDRFVVINQDNSGVSMARNNALQHVKGKYYMFLDSDDWLDPETCEIAYKYAEQNQADCLMFSYTKEFGNHSVVSHIFDCEIINWSKPEVLSNFHRRLFGPIGEELRRPQDCDLIVSPWMQLFRTDKFIHIPFVDIKDIGNFEDGLYQMSVYKDCGRFIYIDRPFYHYRKTNKSSITTRYNPLLFSKWQNLYDIISCYIIKWNLGSEYYEALQNRIAFSIIGLGLNQVRSDDTIVGGSKHLKEILNTHRYIEVLSHLNTSVMPITWKVFFFFAKYRMTILLFAMLKMIEFLRTHKKY